MNFAPAVNNRRAQLDGLDLFYREAGSKDAPIVLLLHGPCFLRTTILSCQVELRADDVDNYQVFPVPRTSSANSSQFSRPAIMSS